MGSVPLVSRRVRVFHLAWVSTVPAAPYQTVHAVFLHTASRPRSSSGMRWCPSSDCSGESIDTEFPRPAVVEPADGETSSGGVFDAGQFRHPPVHVAVDGGELPCRVPVTEVRPSSPQHGVEVTDNVVQVAACEATVGMVTGLGSYGCHGPLRPPLRHPRSPSHAPQPTTDSANRAPQRVTGTHTSGVCGISDADRH